LALSHLLASRWASLGHDPGHHRVLAALLLTTGALACWLPARRATASSQLSRYATNEISSRIPPTTFHQSIHPHQTKSLALTPSTT